MSEVTVDQEMENDFCLDDENEAFFNAPKVTTRDARKIKEKITSQVNDDEEGEGYDESKHNIFKFYIYLLCFRC